MHRRFVALLLLCAMFLLYGVREVLRAAEPRAVQTELDRSSWPLVRKDLLIESSASCSATACHGGPRPGVSNATDLRGSEYPLWIEQDPHARSWRTICSDESVTIMERLKIMQSGKVLDRSGYDNCLACHNSTLEYNEPRSVEHFREGVGCSACHGPSQRWRGKHFSNQWSASHAAEDGFVNAENMLSRARMCAACHVGDRERDMNHDIIAAGHPALHYEFATLHQRQPKHWRDAGERDLSRFEASQWLCGQVAGLDASLVLLESRASHWHTVSLWPELSTMDCASCHQKLRLADPDYSVAKPATSTAQWSQWNRFGLEQLLRLRREEGKRGSADQQLSEALAQLALIIAQPKSSSRQVSEAARVARYALDEWLKSPEAINEIESFSAQRLQQLIISAADETQTFERWEAATQFYLASVAARAAWPKVQSGESFDSGSPLATARQLRSTLTFARGTNSPQELFRSHSKNKIPDVRAAGLNHWEALRQGKIELNRLIEPTP